MVRRYVYVTDAALHKVLLTRDFHSLQEFQGDEVLSEVNEVHETLIYDDEEEFQYFFDDDLTNVGSEETVPAHENMQYFEIPDFATEEVICTPYDILPDVESEKS